MVSAQHIEFRVCFPDLTAQQENEVSGTSLRNSNLVYRERHFVIQTVLVLEVPRKTDGPESLKGRLTWTVPLDGPPACPADPDGENQVGGPVGSGNRYCLTSWEPGVA